jgi:CheY-like chemotaxis protein
MVRLVQTILEANHSTNAVVAASGREALEVMEDVDIVLLDHQLPDTSGLEVLDAIRARPNPPAVVLVTAHGNESRAATALRRGADDYLAKDPSLTDADVELLLADPDTPLDERQESLRGILDSLKRIRDIVRQIGQLREARSKSYIRSIWAPMFPRWRQSTAGRR